MASFLYDAYRKRSMCADEGQIDLAANTLGVSTVSCCLLMGTYTPDATDTNVTTIRTHEHPQTGNYFTGGIFLDNPVVDTSAFSTAYFDADDATWSSATITNARYALLFSGSPSVPIALIDFEEAKSSISADFTIQWSSTGIIVIPYYTTGTYQFTYNEFREGILRGKYQLDGEGAAVGDSIYAQLHTSAYIPLPTHGVADLNNEISGTGYTAGGAALTESSMRVAVSGNTARFDADDVDWTGATLSAIRRVVLRNAGHSNELIAVLDFGSDRAVNAGLFRLIFNTSGICGFGPPA